MKLNDYCGNLAIELTGWKAKMYDVVQKFDKMPTGKKEKVVGEINELHMIIETLSDRIDKLQKECPTSWEPEKAEIAGNVKYMRDKLDNAMNQLAVGDFGG